MKAERQRKTKHREEMKMASLVKTTREYTNRYGHNGEHKETVIEVRMSKANAAKFAEIIENENELDGIVYNTPSAVVDENTIEFANGWTGEAFDGMFADELETVIGQCRGVK